MRPILNDQYLDNLGIIDKLVDMINYQVIN